MLPWEQRNNRHVASNSLSFTLWVVNKLVLAHMPLHLRHPGIFDHTLPLPGLISVQCMVGVDENLNVYKRHQNCLLLGMLAGR